MENQNNNKNYLIPFSILLSAILISATWIYAKGLDNKQIDSETKLKELVLPSNGVELPVIWGNLGKQLAESGVIDKEKFETIYAQKGGLNKEEQKLLYGADNGKLKMNYENSGFILNLFWALGLGNKNEILENGPMMDSNYGGAGRFASTGGWTIAKGDAMNHYSAHKFFILAPEQQKMVERVSKNIYRPCCNNPVYFPDCNHGLAMLGLLELMASQGINEKEMYQAALQVNSYWFPDTYLTIANYLKQKGIDWRNADPKQILGADFSSASGYRKILSQIQPIQSGNGGGCGI